MSGTEETEMLYQIVTHGEAFCPSTMTKETPFANRKLLLDEITNNEKKNEIKEGHYYVVAWLYFQGMMDFINILVFADLYLKVTLERWVHVELLLPYKMHSCPWVWWGLALCNIVFGRQRVYCPRCNSWFFGTEEGQIEKYKNKKEWQKKKRCLLLVKITNNERKAMEAGQIEENEIKEGHDDVEEKQNNKLKIEPFYQPMYLPRYTCDFLMKEGQMEENNKKESQKKREVRIDQYEADWSLLYSQSAVFSPSCRVSSEHMGTRYDNSSSWCVNYVPEEESSERRTNTKLDEILENWLKTEGKSTDAVDFLKHYQPLPPKEAIPKKKRNMKHHGMLPMSGQTGRCVVQDGAQKERGKLIENPELSGKFDDAEKDIQELEQLLRCKVCFDSDACIVFLPCRHMATCEYCEGLLHHCPVCRSFIEEAVKINEE